MRLLKVIFMRPLLLNTKKRIILHVLSLTLILVSALFSAAKAGDIASRHMIGFSADGSYFAFEEYGVQDGSGFPYSNIYITQTKTNSWVKGSPIRVMVQDESQSLDDIRTQAIQKAAPLIDKLKIEHEGLLLAHNPVTELNRPTDEVTVAPGLAPFMVDHALTFSVAPKQLATKRCKDYGLEAQMGYELAVQRKGKEKTILHTDKRIPTSRGCPKRYTISDVVQFHPEGKGLKTIYIVLIQVFSYGFEGDDGRYIAISNWLPAFNAIN